MLIAHFVMSADAIVSYGLANSKKDSFFLFDAENSTNTKSEIFCGTTLLVEVELWDIFISFYFCILLRLQPAKRNHRSHNDAIQKHESKNPFPGWRHRLL